MPKIKIFIGVTLGILLGVLATLPPAKAQSEKFDTGGNVFRLQFDGNVGPILVGRWEANLHIVDSEYKLDGMIVGAGAFKRLGGWDGRFAARGVFKEGKPVSHFYWLYQSEVRDEKLEITTTNIFLNLLVITETDKPTEFHVAPKGTDMMSAIMAFTECQEEVFVHDGEDPSRMELGARKPQQKVRQGRRYWSGEADLCQYKWIYEDEMRKMDIWLGEVDGRKVPVRIAFRLPLKPTAVFKLRSEPWSQRIIDKLTESSPSL